MKKKLAFIIAAIMAASAVSINAVAEEYPEVTVVINGTELESDQPAVIIDGRTMIPMRAVGEALDVSVDWEGETKTVVFAKDGITATLKVGETVLNITDGGVTVPVEIDTPAVIVNGRTLVPVRFVSENFNAQVDWDDATKTVTITRENAVDTESNEEPAADEIDENSVADAKSIALTCDLVTGYLNKYTDDMTEEQYKAYAEYCDTVASALQVFDSESKTYTNEEVQSIMEALFEASAGFDTIAEELGVSDELEAAINAESEKTEETEKTDNTDNDAIAVDTVKELLDTVSNLSNTLADADMNDEQKEIYNGFTTLIEEVNSSLDTLKTEKDCMEAIDILTSVQKGFDNLAEELEISIY